MRAGFIYFKLHCKKYGKILPMILAESFLFALLIVLLGMMAVKILGEGSGFTQIKVGVVSEEEESLTGLLVSFVEGMDSLEDNCSFELMEEQDAYEALEAGELYAAVFLPEGILDSILNGTNLPARVVLSRACSELETAVFEEVAGAGGRMLSIAQAGIYAADELCLETGHPERIVAAEAYLNDAYLNYALNRTSIFEQEEIAATGKVGAVTYYAASLLLVFLTFAAVVMGRYVKVRPDAHTMLIAVSGMNKECQYLCDVLAFTAIVTAVGGVMGCPLLYVCAGRENMMKEVVPLCGVYIWILFSMALFVRLLLQICGNDNGGMGTVFAFTFVIMFVCGLFVPTAFLPVSLERLGQWLPYKYWLTMILNAFGGDMKPIELFAMLLGNIATFFLGMGLFLLGDRPMGKEEAG